MKADLSCPCCGKQNHLVARHTDTGKEVLFCNNCGKELCYPALVWWGKATMPEVEITLKEIQKFVSPNVVDSIAVELKTKPNEITWRVVWNSWCDGTWRIPTPREAACYSWLRTMIFIKGKVGRRERNRIILGRPGIPEPPEFLSKKEIAKIPRWIRRLDLALNDRTKIVKGRGFKQSIRNLLAWARKYETESATYIF